MKIRNKRLLILSAISAMLLSSGCEVGVDVPDELKDSSSSAVDSSSYADSSSQTPDVQDSGIGIDENEHETITLSSLSQNKQAEIDKIYSLDCDNFTFTEGIDFIVPQKAGKYYIKKIEGFHTHADKLFEKYIPEDVFDESKIVLDERYVPYGPFYLDESIGLRVDTGEGGYFIYEPIGSDKASETQTEYSEYYYIGASAVDDTVLLDGKEVKISELWDKTDAFIGEFKECAECSNNFIPFVAVVDKVSGSKNNMVSLAFRSTVNGLPYNSLRQRYAIEGEPNPDIAKLNAGHCEYLSGDGFFNFTIEGCLEVSEMVADYDSIITPSCAVKLLSDKLSGYAQYDVLGVELAYSQLDSENNRSIEPFWFVYFDLEPQREIFGMIHAITGEVVFVNNKTAG